MSQKLSVLIVDDNRTSLALMDMLLRKLPDCRTLLQTSPDVLVADIARLDYDLAIIAWRPPQLDGIALARRLKAEPRLRDRPVLLAADEPDAALRARALEAGVGEVLAKPIDPVDLRARIRGLARSDAGPGIAAGGEAGWDGVSASPQGLTANEEEYLGMLVKVAGCRDRETPMHGQRVARYCALLAHNLGLSDEFCRDIRHAAPLHDIGKAALGDQVLRKTGFLSPEERSAMEEHTRIGYAMLRDQRSRVLRMAADIALGHHERWDGSGYPQRLKGEQIALAARITAVADVFDALTSLRSYKTAWSLANAFNYLHENAGEQFDPACVAAFTSSREEISEILRSMPDPDDGTADAA